MSVAVRVFHAGLLERMGNPEDIRVTGSTVGECLEDLVARYPAARDVLFDAAGRLRRHFHVFVNAESLGRIEMSRSVTDGDTLLIALLTAGG